MQPRSFWIERDRAQIHGVTFGAGPPLLCVHALAFSSRYFSAMAAQLGTRFHCVAIDQRGHGATRSPLELAQLGISTLVDDLLAVIDHFGWDRVYAGGISLGAATTLRLALDHPQRVAALIQDLPAFGPRSPRGGDRSAFVAQALEAGDLEEAALRAAAGRSAPRTRALAAQLTAAWTGENPHALGPKLAAMFRASAHWSVAEPWPDRLRTLTIPVEILGIAGDPSHPLGVAEQMAAVIPAARLHRRVASLDPERVAAQWLAVSDWK